MRIWWAVVFACGPSEPAKSSAPPKTEVPVVQAPPAPAWPPLGTDLAVIGKASVELWTPTQHPMEEGTEVSLPFAIGAAVWGGDHRLYAMKSDGIDERVAVAIDASGVREIAIPEAKPSSERGFPLRSTLEAYDDGSVWFVECWGPKYRPKSAQCATYHRVRLDAAGEDDSSSKVARRTPHPLPAIPPPADHRIVLAGNATVTCGDRTIVREHDMVPYREAHWLLRSPELYVLVSDSWPDLYRGCDPDRMGTAFSAARSGYYAFRWTAWHIAHGGTLVRELAGDAVVFGP